MKTMAIFLSLTVLPEYCAMDMSPSCPVGVCKPSISWIPS